MANSGGRDPINAGNTDASDRDDHDTVDINNDDAFESSADVVSGGSDAVSGTSRGRSAGLTERLTGLLEGEGDGDLLIGTKDGGATVMQWLQALDLQVVGACRVDERLKPMLKSSAAGAAADDRLLAHLSQYFEPSEVGLLAMCLCMPLVSMRVGKVLKQGSHLCPTTVRGDLNLVLLPTSDLRLSFVGDDGQTEILCTMSCDSDCCTAAIEEISADSSGRSFLVKCPESDAYYFWCSENSKLLGIELLAKMKDLCKRMPSLAELTGISHSRLDCFATHLRAYFSGSTSSKTRPTSRNLSSHCPTASELLGPGPGADCKFLMSKSPRHRSNGNQGMKSSSPCQSSLSPRPSLFKEGMGRNPFSLKSVAREKLRWRGGDITLSALENIAFDSTVTSQTFSGRCGQEKHSEVSRLNELPTHSLNESLETVPPSFCSAITDLSSRLAICSPAYCWCPIGSNFVNTSGSLQLPLATTKLRTLPPLSSLLPAGRSSSLLTPLSPPTLELPSYLLDPLPRLPFSTPSSHQIPNFIPLICDPIVHIPIIDICSSGQGYLVSAASGTTLPPLHPTLMNQLLPEDNMVENGAKETLRRLIGNSDRASPPLMDMFSVSDDEKPGILVGGSRGLYSGTCDVDMIANSIAALGMISLTERSIEGDSYKTRKMQGNCDLETSNSEDPFNQTNPNSMGERLE
uniref:Uncharacterized protein n=2 Tax=Kalanchoe fedtschenkoi TaxID=63787 RepID=A0A7N0TPI7_KALFE